MFYISTIRKQCCLGHCKWIGRWLTQQNQMRAISWNLIATVKDSRCVPSSIRMDHKPSFLVQPEGMHDVVWLDWDTSGCKWYCWVDEVSISSATSVIHMLPLAINAVCSFLVKDLFVYFVTLWYVIVNIVLYGDLIWLCLIYLQFHFSGTPP